MSGPITEEWLKQVGFVWSQFDRQPDKHWTLWLGPAIAESNTAFEDIGLELAPWADGEWFCWLRSDAGGRYSRFVHVRHLRWCEEVGELVAALSGTPLDPAKVYFGALKGVERAERIRAERDRLDRRMLRNDHPRHDVERDPALGGARAEHLQAYKERRGDG